MKRVELDGVLADYADDAILVSPPGLVTPAGTSTMLFRWTQFPGTPKEVKGYDIFVFREGKIIFQTTAPNP